MDKKEKEKNTQELNKPNTKQSTTKQTQTKSKSVPVLVIILIMVVVLVAGYVICKTIAGEDGGSLVSGAIDASYVKQHASEMYGTVVSNYDESGDMGVAAWQIFDSDGENIYLIAASYVEYDKLPNSTKNNVPTEHKPDQLEGYEKAATLKSIIDDYDGSNSISQANPARKFLSKYYANTVEEENENMNVIAYLMDVSAWSSFAGKNAYYVIGGPTIEMYFDSYNAKYGTNYECQIGENNGYQIKINDETGFEEDHKDAINKNDSLYVLDEEAGADGMWMASPANRATVLTTSIAHTGRIFYDFYESSASGFRPVVCLSSDTKLVEQIDGTYQIK